MDQKSYVAYTYFSGRKLPLWARSWLGATAVSNHNNIAPKGRQREATKAILHFIFHLKINGIRSVDKMCIPTLHR